MLIFALATLVITLSTSKNLAGKILLKFKQYKFPNLNRLHLHHLRICAFDFNTPGRGDLQRLCHN